MVRQNIVCIQIQDKISPRLLQRGIPGGCLSPVLHGDNPDLPACSLVFLHDAETFVRAAVIDKNNFLAHVLTCRALHGLQNVFFSLVHGDQNGNEMILGLTTVQQCFKSRFPEYPAKGFRLCRNTGPAAPSVQFSRILYRPPPFGRSQRKFQGKTVLRCPPRIPSGINRPGRIQVWTTCSILPQK